MISTFIKRFSSFHVNLERGVVSVKGEDSVKFLHGLVTSNVNSLYHTTTPSAQFSAFLNSTGRVLFDCFLWRSPFSTSNGISREILIDCQKPYVTDILVHLEIYKVRARVEIADVSDKWCVFGAASQPEGCIEECLSSGISVIKDMRSLKWSMLRVLLPHGQTLDIPSSTPATRQKYRIERMLAGVPEGFVEIKSGSAIPFDYNLDTMGAIDFQKGCYIGQELVTRTRHQGLIRKRCHPIKLYQPEHFKPFEFDPEFSKRHVVLPDTELWGASIQEMSDNYPGILPYQAHYDVKYGRIVRTIGNLGIAVIREEHLARTQWAAIRTEEPSMAVCQVQL